MTASGFFVILLSVSSHKLFASTVLGNDCMAIDMPSHAKPSPNQVSRGFAKATSLHKTKTNRLMMVPVMKGPKVIKNT